MIKIFENKDLTGLNTFGMKVAAALFVDYDDKDDLLQLPSAMPQPIYHIGGGSNLLFTGNFVGSLLHSSIKFIDLDEKNLIATVGAGVLWDDFCQYCSDKQLWGVENLSLIPGEAGAAAVQNIGAYGVEIKDVLHTVDCFDLQSREYLSFTCEECNYSYRNSRFKSEDKARYVIVSVKFKLKKSYSPLIEYGNIKHLLEEKFPEEYKADKLTPALLREAIIQLRQSKLPPLEKFGSAGSFFKNPIVSQSTFTRILAIAEKCDFGEVPHYMLSSKEPMVKIPAAWLIEKCGWKGYKEGNVGVYDKQALVLVNFNHMATPDEIINLENKIVQSVNEKFGISLEAEVEHL